jgi:4'-phosphopantetheinyl transferase EntD
VIEKILPDGVMSAEAFGDEPAGGGLVGGEPAGGGLVGAEEQTIARAVDRRRREFTTGRACARLALGRLDIPPVAILSGEKGAPQWPAGVVGSITHCDGYRAAAVARQTDVTAIGIDAEPHGPLPKGVLDHIARPEELARLPDLRSAAPLVCWDRLLSSAKESIYKAWYPLARRWLGFEDATVAAEPDGGFTACLLVPAPAPLAADLRGRWLVDRGLVVTALTVARR